MRRAGIIEQKFKNMIGNQLKPNSTRKSKYQNRQPLERHLPDQAIIKLIMDQGKAAYPLIHEQFYPVISVKLKNQYSGEKQAVISSGFETALFCLGDKVEATEIVVKGGGIEGLTGTIGEFLEHRTSIFLENPDVLLLENLKKDMEILQAAGRKKSPEEKVFLLLEDLYGARLERRLQDQYTDEEEILDALYFASISLVNKVKEEKVTVREPNASTEDISFFVERRVRSYLALLSSFITAYKTKFDYLRPDEFRWALNESLKKAPPGQEEIYVKDVYEQQLMRRHRHKKNHPDDYYGIKSLSERDNASFTPIYKRLLEDFKKINGKRLNRRLANPDEDLEELYQEALTDLIIDYIDTKKFRIVQDWVVGLFIPLKSWLITRGYNKWKFGKKNKWQVEVEGEIEEAPGNLKPDMYQETLLTVLEDELNKLKPADKEIIKLSYFEELSHEEIAEQLGLASAGVSRVKLHRAIKRLREKMERRLEELDLDFLQLSEEILMTFLGLSHLLDQDNQDDDAMSDEASDTQDQHEDDKSPDEEAEEND